tara:strand:- start:61 stop:294 length:234 start_codon:yes stop_codon:yes gene_type:complete
MEMKKNKFVVLPSLIALVIGVIAVMFLLIKLMWAWTVPDLFPGAVEQGLVAAEISWLTSFKLAVFFAMLTGAIKLKS